MHYMPLHATQDANVPGIGVEDKCPPQAKLSFKLPVKRFQVGSIEGFALLF